MKKVDVGDLIVKEYLREGECTVCRVEHKGETIAMFKILGSLKKQLKKGNVVISYDAEVRMHSVFVRFNVYSHFMVFVVCDGEENRRLRGWKKNGL